MLKKYWQYLLIILVLIFCSFYLFSKIKYQQKIKNDTSSASTKREDDSQIPNPAPRTYTIKPGDTLWDIAQKEYGSGFKYHDIIAKNPGKTFKFKNGNEGLIFPGTVLIL